MAKVPRLSVKLDSEGKQPYLGGQIRPEDLYKKLKEPNQVLLVEDMHGKPCTLKCKGCNTLLSPDNPTQVCK
jgi:hypothetical protein